MSRVAPLKTRGQRFSSVTKPIDRSGRTSRKTVPLVDIVIDDGGHLPEQQLVTLEELLPHVRPGGVYFCEDIHYNFNDFAAYVQGLSDNLNEFHR